MPKTYVTFGQIHVHSVNGRTFDKDCIAVINCTDADDGRRKAFEIFKSKFCFEYHEDEWNLEDMIYYPRGLITVN